MKVKSESEFAQSCLTVSYPWTAAYQAPPSMGFSRLEYWSRAPLPSPTNSRQVHLNPIVSIITLNVNNLSAPNKKQDNQTR